MMTSTPHSPSIYPEIVIHATLKLMTKLTDYPSPVKQETKQEAKFEAKRSNEEVIMLQKTAINSY